jgi:hypothetical protein
MQIANEYGKLLVHQHLAGEYDNLCILEVPNFGKWCGGFL